MTNAESKPVSKGTNNSLDPAWNRPWANEWCLSEDLFEGSDLALQARFTRFDVSGEVDDMHTSDCATDQSG